MARKRKQDDPLAALLAAAPTGTLADLLVRLATTRPDVCRECFDYLKKHLTLSPSQRRQSKGERPLALWDELAPDLEALDECGSGDYGADARVFSLLHEIEQALSRKQIEAGYRHELLDNVLPYIESGNAGLEGDLYAVAHATCYTATTIGGRWRKPSRPWAGIGNLTMPAAFTTSLAAGTDTSNCANEYWSPMPTITTWLISTGKPVKGRGPWGTSAFRERDQFVLSKVDPLCAQWFVDGE